MSQPVSAVLPRAVVPAPASISRRAMLTSFACAAGILRIATALRFRIDSDETQHLHVVWAWMHGLLPYRDVFDNHMPLFHILSVPLLWMAGERSIALLFMRFAMLPIFAAALGLTYAIARSCHSQREAQWATALLALVPTFFLCSLEYRPDGLWAVFWLAVILVLVDRPLTGKRAIAAGLLLGTAFAISMKTSLLLVALIAGCAVTRLALPGTVRWLRISLRNIALFASSAAIVPSLIGLFFAARGAFREFVYGTLGHNIVANWHRDRLFEYPLLLVLIFLFGRQILRSDEGSSIVGRRLFLFVTSQFYGATLYCLWPFVEREHWLPYFPLAVIGLAPVVSRWRWRAGVLFAEAAVIVVLAALWRDDTVSSLRLIDDTLRLTTPREAVVDRKGETVFRPRAFPHVLEAITLRRLRTGDLSNSLLRAVIATRPMVAVADDAAFPVTIRRFLSTNFIGVGSVRVAGWSLPGRGGSFTVSIPGTYAFLSGGGDFRGLVDGRVYRGATYLPAGPHTVRPDSPTTRVAAIWSRAFDLGYRPAFRPQRERQ